MPKEKHVKNPNAVLIEDIERAAKVLNIPLFEYVYIPHVSSNKKRPVRTKTRVLVGYLNIKRVQQLQQKKSTGIITDTDRDEITGIAKGDAKGGRQTGVENQILMGLGGDIILSEIVGSKTKCAILNGKFANRNDIILFILFFSY